MNKVSIIIPSYRDPYLNKTLESILNAAKEDIEIIVFLDSYKDQLDIINNNAIKYIKSEKNVGMRAAINKAVNKSNGKYIMKLDSHCNISDGFDVQMKIDSNPDRVQIPSRYNLDVETWDKYHGPIDYLYLKFPSNLKKEIGFRSRLFETKTNYEHNNMIEDIITFQGSCWFMEREFFDKIGGLNEDIFGIWGMEAQEISMKSWLCYNGSVVRNRKIWYSHYKRKRIQNKAMRNNMLKNMRNVFSMCMLDTWPKQNKPFKWLIDRLGPFPGWPENWNTDEYINNLKLNKYI